MLIKSTDLSSRRAALIWFKSLASRQQWSSDRAVDALVYSCWVDVDQALSCRCNMIWPASVKSRAVSDRAIDVELNCHCLMDIDLIWRRCVGCNLTLLIRFCIKKLGMENLLSLNHRTRVSGDLTTRQSSHSSPSWFNQVSLIRNHTSSVSSDLITHHSNHPSPSRSD